MSSAAQARAHRQQAGILDVAARGAVSLAEHDSLHGGIPGLTAAELLAEVTAAGLTGRGGAAFPLHRKLSAVAAGAGTAVVVANGAEGEPASNKDKRLLLTNPHATLDGLQLAARATGADTAYVYVHADLRLLTRLHDAVEERRRACRDEVPVTVVPAPPAFVSGEESAVASRVSGGPARPRSKPPRVFESGVHGRPTLVSNVETLARLAVVARDGGESFRAVGDPDMPGPMLFTVSGAVDRAGVVEAPTGAAIAELVDRVGGATAPVGAVLVGGYHGGWLRWPDTRDLPMANQMLRPLGSAVGAGVLIALPATACGVLETVRVLDYLAAESAGQCGPCIFGLSRLAVTFRELALGRGGRRRSRRLEDLMAAVAARGGCAHPDGTLRFLTSAINVFADELRLHTAGRCSATTAVQVLPTPGVMG